MKKNNDTMKKRICQLESKLKAKDDHIKRLEKWKCIQRKTTLLSAGPQLRESAERERLGGGNGTSSQSGGELSVLRKKIAVFVTETMRV